MYFSILNIDIESLLHIVGSYYPITAVHLQRTFRSRFQPTATSSESQPALSKN